MKKIIFIMVISLAVFAGCSMNNEYLKIKTTAMLIDYQGQRVQLSGIVAQEIWQHLINAPETHPFINYINVGDAQVVVYSQGNIICESTVKIYGIVKRVEGQSKKPGSEEKYTEYHIIADKWKCG